MDVLGLVLATVLVVSTANVRVGMPADRARHDVLRAAAGADVLLLQEMSGRRIARFTPAGFRCWQAPSGPAREVPVCWRVARFAYIDAHTRILAVSHLFRSATRAASILRLRDRLTGRVWPVVDVHLIPHIERAGHLRDLPRRRVALRELATLDQLSQRLADRWHRAIIGGDLNVDAIADRRVRDRGLVWWRMNHGANYDTAWNVLPLTAPTLGARRVDYVWWLKRAARAIWSRTIGRTYSDHNSVRVGLVIR